MPTTSVTIDITTPAAVPISEVVDTLATYWGWTPASSQTKAQYIKARIAAEVRQAYISAKAEGGAAAGRLTAITDAEKVSAS